MKIDKQEEELEVCGDCLGELTYKKTDIDGYQECNDCGRDDFTNNGHDLVILKATRTILTIETLEIKKGLGT